MMSSSRALCCLPSVKKQKHDFNFFRSMYNKTIILDITKTSSNNCLQLYSGTTRQMLRAGNLSEPMYYKHNFVNRKFKFK